jgi:hypothetical protein
MRLRSSYLKVNCKTDQNCVGIKCPNLIAQNLCLLHNANAINAHISCVNTYVCSYEYFRYMHCEEAILRKL